MAPSAWPTPADSKSVQAILEEGLQKQESANKTKKKMMKERRKQTRKRNRESRSQCDQISSHLSELDLNLTLPAQRQKPKRSKQSQNNTEPISITPKAPHILPRPKANFAKDSYDGGSQSPEVGAVKVEKPQDRRNRAVLDSISQQNCVGADDAPDKKRKKRKRESLTDEVNTDKVEISTQCQTKSTEDQEKDLLPQAVALNETIRPKKKRRSSERKEDMSLEDGVSHLKGGVSSHQQRHAPERHLVLDAIAAPKSIENLVSNMCSPNDASPRNETPNLKLKAELLLQTVLKGRKHADIINLENCSGGGALTDHKLRDTPALREAELVVANKLKAKKAKNSGAKNDAKANDTGNNNSQPQESLSQTIESIKRSSISKLQNIFSPVSLESPKHFNFFNDEPLAQKRDRMFPVATWPLLKPICPAHKVAVASGRASLEIPLTKQEKTPAAATRQPTQPPILPHHFSQHLNKVVAKLPVADKISARAPLSEEWERSPGKIRGIVTTRTDEWPEENIAFSFSYISDRPQGVNIDESSFNVVNIESGREYKSRVDKRSTLRICSVASGRVEVVLGKMNFHIGENGMWRIKKKEHCVVKNQANVAAVLHITSIA